MKHPDVWFVAALWIKPDEPARQRLRIKKSNSAKPTAAQVQTDDLTQALETASLQLPELLWVSPAQWHHLTKYLTMTRVLRLRWHETIHVLVIPSSSRPLIAAHVPHLIPHGTTIGQNSMRFIHTSGRHMRHGLHVPSSNYRSFRCLQVAPGICRQLCCEAASEDARGARFWRRFDRPLVAVVHLVRWVPRFLKSGMQPSPPRRINPGAPRCYKPLIIELLGGQSTLRRSDVPRQAARNVSWMLHGCLKSQF